MEEEGKQRLLSSLQPIRLDDKAIFDLAFGNLKQPISDYCFACSYMWAEALRTTWALLHRHVCVFANGAEDLTLLCPPIGLPGATTAEFAAAVTDCFEIMDDYNAPRHGVERSRIEYVSDELLELFSEASPFPLTAAPLWSDYVYDTSRLITLEGGDLKSKRHGRSKFMRDFPEHRTEPMTRAHIDACCALLDRWANHGDDTHEGEVNDAQLGTDILRHKDREATHRAIRNFDQIGLVGMVVMVGDQLAGFTLGTPISPMQAMVLVEKTAPEFAGCPQFIFSEFCRTTLAAYPECNAGDDWGIPTLRFTKQSYRPIRVQNKHVLSRAPVPLAVHLPSAQMPPLRREPANPPRPQMLPLNSTPTVRAATTADLDSILAVESDCFEREAERFGRRQIRTLLQNPRATVLVVELEGRIVGWAASLRRRHKSWHSGRIYSVGIRSDSRGHGLGKLLTVALLDRFREAGISRAYLEVRADNTTALRLYETLGFKPIRTLTAYYGPGADALSCRADLSPTAQPEP
jgi:ribosomal protein S18 acetylase RimI-like enzyme